MYLTNAIIDLTGGQHPMVGIVPGNSQMQQRRASLGYRLVESPEGNFLLPPGLTTRGHEFHWSAWLTAEQQDLNPAWHIGPRHGEQASRPDGYSQGNLIASYVHLHFAHATCLAENFVQTCRRWREGTISQNAAEKQN
jgi:cobyrinic acid a,c-diamide synthase